MEKRIIKNDTTDGDWKTESVKPQGVFKIGDEVEVIDRFSNFDGKWITIKHLKDGRVIDVREEDLK